ncbi:SRPBCC family protein [Allokutzneria oryzae]|uniref:SRPBCC family protein n=1 Tax=Allokutzneria oryzae TaxID=1378989 RepID=A0ABV6A4W2_9PSEU
MSTRTTHETTIEADPALPTIRIVREFDAPAAKVYRAWAEPELAAKWLGPNSTTTEIHSWDLRTGGSYRYSSSRDGEIIASFYGSFHEARPGERLVQTFTYEGFPDGVSLETATFEDLPDGRSRVVVLSVVETMEARDAMIASGMEVGVVEGYEKLDALLADS